jgi:(1->4)-alpha-D-glucan 1-alpha-D-glucosylmutase
MTPLIATYRLQFREGMDFEQAAQLVPYLAKLGVSHLYASPVFAAVPGSSHGYDITRYDAIEDSLGGAEGLAALSKALADHGLGLILDFVPNHMGASPHSPWWRDVLEWGQQSDHASYFDIDWTAPKLLIPALAEPYGLVLAKGGFSLGFDQKDGGLSFRSGVALPLTPPSYATVLARIEGDRFEDLVNRFAIATPETAADLKAELSERTEEPALHDALLAALEDLHADPGGLHELHEAQIWRLAYWRTARETLTYRRFFEVADLVGIRMEQPSVFDAAHRLVLELVKEGSIGGLRLDHVDGLADPKAYFEKLREAIGDDQFVILIEKILGEREELRADWPVAGTTGYEFIRSLGGAFTDPQGEAPLTNAYHDFIGESLDYADLLVRTKRHILIRNLAAELDVLAGLAHSLAENDLTTRDFGRDTLRRAIIEMAVALPVYRTYVDVGGCSPEDETLIADAAEQAKSTREVEDEAAIDFIARIWCLQLEDPAQRAAALNFTTRLQQTTGPLMAKAIEDTLFYRYNRLIALNEVGGSPDAFGCSIAEFHADMLTRLKHQPRGLLSTSTHDSKRGEDSRARLYALSEAPQRWIDAIARWREMNRSLLSDVNDLPAPDRNDEWMFYQALAGAWPQDLQPSNGNGLAALAERMSAFMQKAIREAKRHTSWTAPEEAYEQSVDAFVRDTLDPGCSADFLQDFTSEQGWLIRAGALNGLSQTLIKLTAPGVPDIYQGAELWELSLVDPDNRRPVDFARREALLEAGGRPGLLGAWQDGESKLQLIKTVLALRRSAPALFTTGDYVPLEVKGSHARRVLAFARRDGNSVIITIAPTLATCLIALEDSPFVPAEAWEDTALVLPKDWTGVVWRDCLIGETLETRDASLPLAGALQRLPIALLRGELAETG